MPSHDTAAKSITRQLIDNETNNLVGRSIISSKALMVTLAGTYTFTYSLSPEKLQLLNCQGTNICYDCLYQLNISIIPDCSEIVIAGLVNSIVQKNFTLGEYLNDCNSANPSLQNTFSKVLPEGAYTIIKELKLSGDAQTYYRDNAFLTTNTCKFLQDYISTEYNLWANQQNCNPTHAS